MQSPKLNPNYPDPTPRRDSKRAWRRATTTTACRSVTLSCIVCGIHMLCWYSKSDQLELQQHAQEQKPKSATANNQQQQQRRRRQRQQNGAATTITKDNRSDTRMQLHCESFQQFTSKCPGSLAVGSGTNKTTDKGTAYLPTTTTTS